MIKDTLVQIARDAGFTDIVFTGAGLGRINVYDYVAPLTTAFMRVAMQNEADINSNAETLALVQSVRTSTTDAKGWGPLAISPNPVFAGDLPSSPVFDIRAYGAVGDGLTHPLSDYFTSFALAEAYFPFVEVGTWSTQEIDGCAIQKAITTAEAASPLGKVFVPAGKYRTTFRLQIRKAICLSGFSRGSAATAYSLTPDPPSKIIWYGPDGDIVLLVADDDYKAIDNLMIEYLTIDGGDTTPKTGAHCAATVIELRGVGNSFIRHIHGMGYNGIGMKLTYHADLVNMLGSTVARTDFHHVTLDGLGQGIVANELDEVDPVLGRLDRTASTFYNTFRQVWVHYTGNKAGVDMKGDTQTFYDLAVFNEADPDGVHGYGFGVELGSTRDEICGSSNFYHLTPGIRGLRVAAYRPWFQGTGLDDMIARGDAGITALTCPGVLTENHRYVIEIDGTGSPNTFKWHRRVFGKSGSPTVYIGQPSDLGDKTKVYIIGIDPARYNVGDHLRVFLYKTRVWEERTIATKGTSVCTDFDGIGTVYNYVTVNSTFSESQWKQVPVPDPEPTLAAGFAYYGCAFEIVPYSGGNIDYGDTEVSIVVPDHSKEWSLRTFQAITDGLEIAFFSNALHTIGDSWTVTRNPTNSTAVHGYALDNQEVPPVVDEGCELLWAPSSRGTSCFNVTAAAGRSAELMHVKTIGYGTNTGDRGYVVTCAPTAATATLINCYSVVSGIAQNASVFQVTYGDGVHIGANSNAVAATPLLTCWSGVTAIFKVTYGEGVIAYTPVTAILDTDVNALYVKNVTTLDAANALVRLDVNAHRSSPAISVIATDPTSAGEGVAGQDIGIKLDYAVAGVTSTFMHHIVGATHPLIAYTDGAMVLGEATGAKKAAGTINAKGFYVNGALLSSGQFTTYASGIYYTGGKVGFGTTAPDKAVEINSATGACLRLTYNKADGSAVYYTDFAVTATGALSITPTAGAGVNFALSTTGDFSINTNQVFVDTSSGFVAIGAAVTDRILRIATTDVTDQRGAAIEQYSADTLACRLRGRKSRHATIGSHTRIDVSDAVFSVIGDGSDGSVFLPAAQITFFIDGAPDTNVMPGGISFFTNSGGTSVTERMRITKDGNFGINCTAITNLGNAWAATPILNMHGAGTTPVLAFSTNIDTTDGYPGAIAFGTIGCANAEKRSAFIASKLTATSRTTVSGNLEFWTTSASVIGQRMQIGATGIVKIGTVATNYAQFAANGTLTFVGTARYIRDVQIPVAAMAKGAAAPDVVYLGDFAGDSYKVNDYVYFTTEIPYDWDATADLIIELHWYCTSGTADRWVKWELKYTIVKEDGSEPVDAGSLSLYAEDLVSTTAKGLYQSEFTIPAAQIAPDDNIGFTLIRRTADGTAPSANPVVTSAMFEVTCNKLGEAL